MDPIHDPRCRGLAMEALHAGMDHDWTTARHALEMLTDEYGGAGTEAAVLVWCDSLIVHMGGWGDRPAIGLVFEEYATGEAHTADTVSPADAWAGRVLVARQRLDKDMFGALMSVIADQPELAPTHIVALLTMISLTLASHIEEHHSAPAEPRPEDRDPRLGPADWPKPPRGSLWN